jgi:SAM-dependent methyltransferase
MPMRTRACSRTARVRLAIRQRASRARARGDGRAHRAAVPPRLGSGRGLPRGARVPPARKSLAEVARELGLTYQADALQYFARRVPFLDRRVLEVGGSTPPEIGIELLGARTWICVDDITRYRELKTGGAAQHVVDLTGASLPERGWGVHDGRIQDMPEHFRGQFDVVLSIATLEHVTELPVALRRMNEALAPRGTMAHAVGPIWSGPRGYHVMPGYFKEFGERTADFCRWLRPWQHLLYTVPQMFHATRARFGSAFAEVAIHSIYESNRLNRLHAEEYLLYFEAMGFETLRPDGHSIGGDLSLLPSVKARYPMFSLFAWDGFSSVSRKKCDV